MPARWGSRSRRSRVPQSLCSPGSIQDIAIVFNVIIVFLMFFNTYVFQAGLVNLLFHKFKGTILLSAAYLALSISFHIWIMVGRGGHSCWVLPRDFSMTPGFPQSFLTVSPWNVSHGRCPIP